MKLIKILKEIKIKNINNPDYLKNILPELIEAGYSFDDGILGGVGSGGGGYYDSISDKISGYNLDEFNEHEFNNWYDNFTKNSFNKYTYTGEDSGNLLQQVGSGIYSVKDNEMELGYAEVHSNGDVTLYSTPTLTNINNDEYLPIFQLRSNGYIERSISKTDLEHKLKENINNPASWAII